ncbi:SEC14-like protein 3 [Leptotrombidium deliense]|uniref:SEC14-like protein 3 n=1 Tax=Leptotrombidium deliense TaxID=299467 RepID=A0A443SNS8_9ACAR|nr:SEC14-like protein 3 [Leptotrombidium deliense]
MINPYELPVHWGGTKVDPVDGDLRCPSVVCCGGQVPCSYYTTPSRRLSIDQNLESVVVDKKSFHIIQLNVEIARSMIRWEFKTENYDIAFCVYRQRTIEELEGPNSGDDEDIVVPYQRVNCHLVPEDGLVVVEKPGKCTCTVLFT